MRAKTKGKRHVERCLGMKINHTLAKERELHNAYWNRMMRNRP